MENTAATPIHLLRPYTKVLKIKVRVCRIWRPRFPGSVEKYSGLRCILVDEMQHVVEACTADIDYEIIASKIEAGGCYEIMDFHVNKMRGQYRVVPHDTQFVFTGKTTFKKLTSVFPPIPRHRFYLQDYNSLYPRLNRVDILTDIMGRITAVQHLEQKQINQRIEPKCDIIIQNIRFANCTEAVKKLPPSSKHANEAEVLQAAKKVTIEELAFLDPDLHKDDTFYCKACVKRFDTRYDWWYSAYPNCAKQMQKDPTTGQLVCQKHGSQIPTAWYKVNLVLEDETNETNALIIGESGEKLFGSSCKDLVMNQRLVDQQQLPNEFSRLIGQKKIFHLRFGTRKNNLNTNDLLISNVSEDTTVQPTTPQALLTEITVSSTTVSSSTSTPETTAQSYKRKRESVKRSLFTSSEQRL